MDNKNRSASIAVERRDLAKAREVVPIQARSSSSGRTPAVEKAKVTPPLLGRRLSTTTSSTSKASSIISQRSTAPPAKKPTPAFKKL